MTGWSDLLIVSGASLAAVALLMAATAIVARRIGRVSVVDTTWGLGLVAVALVGMALGTAAFERRLLLLVLVAVWGLRLAWHVHRRNRGKGEDPRYEAMLDEAPGSRFAYAVRKVFVLQGAAVWFISLPIQVAAVSSGGLGWVAGLGVLVWLVGVAFESVGDRQLARYKADPDRGPVMDRGLWAWTRHPNYFGDACVWWGTFLVAADVWPGVLTVVSPMAMTYLLVWGTGARLLERSMVERPGYRDYMERTSFFVPLPPRRRVRHGRSGSPRA